MKKFLLAVAILFTPAVVSAQQPDPAFLQRALSSMQLQRNAALDAQVVAEAKLQAIQEDLTKSQAKIKELEDAKPK